MAAETVRYHVLHRCGFYFYMRANRFSLFSKQAEKKAIIQQSAIIISRVRNIQELNQSTSRQSTSQNR